MKPEAEKLLLDIEKHTDEIWIEEPYDIFLLKNGIIESGAGIKDQYFTVLVMLSGEVRALGIHVFSDLLEFARSGSFTLAQLCAMAKKMLAVDLGVISYFGLPAFGELLGRFAGALDELESEEEFTLACQKMFTLANRYQLWMHQIFPWKLMGLFPKARREDVLAKARRLQEGNDLS